MKPTDGQQVGNSPRDHQQCCKNCCCLPNASEYSELRNCSTHHTGESAERQIREQPSSVVKRVCANGITAPCACRVRADETATHSRAVHTAQQAGNQDSRQGEVHYSWLTGVARTVAGDSVRTVLVKRWPSFIATTRISQRPV